MNGDTLVQGKSGLPIFVGVMSFAVKAVIEKAAADGDLEDGDIYIFNDAHIGGTHLSDMRLVRPYFRDGVLFCYLASVGHWHDMGGAVPGTITQLQQMFSKKRLFCLRSSSQEREKSTKTSSTSCCATPVCRNLRGGSKRPAQRA